MERTELSRREGTHPGHQRDRTCSIVDWSGLAAIVSTCWCLRILGIQIISQEGVQRLSRGQHQDTAVLMAGATQTDLRNKVQERQPETMD